MSDETPAATAPAPAPKPPAGNKPVPLGRSSHRLRSWIIFLVLMGGLGFGGYRLYGWRQAQSAVSLPVAPARQGDFMVIIRCRGDLKAARSVSIYAPTVPNLRIAWLAAAGERVEKGDTIIK